jgi:hypothetical protein
MRWFCLVLPATIALSLGLASQAATPGAWRNESRTASGPLNTGLVEWAWAPGTDRTGKERTPPPVSRDEFIALTKAWIDAGAVCSKSGAVCPK